MVVTDRPSAWTASIVHDLALSPSTRTVQAPQLLVSHPMWVPVSRKSSRSRWTSRSLGSTSASRVSPLTLTRMWVVATSVLLSIGGSPIDRAAQRPHCHLGDHCSLVIRRTVPVVGRPAHGGRGCTCLAEGGLGGLSTQKHRFRIGGCERCLRHGSQPQSNLAESAIQVQPDLCRRADPGEVAS